MDIPMEDIQAILQAYPPEQRFSLAMLQDMQHKFNYIPREGMEALAAYLGCPLSSLYAMATFYKALSLKPKGRHIIKLCDGTACHIRGSVNLVGAVERLLGIRPGSRTGTLRPPIRGQNVPVFQLHPDRLLWSGTVRTCRDIVCPNCAQWVIFRQSSRTNFIIMHKLYHHLHKKSTLFRVYFM